MKLRKLLLAALLPAVITSAAHAGEQFVDKDGVANFGYDVVAYHITFKPTKGSEQFVANHNAAPFWFVSAANRDLFLADPETFAPAYDGHCAYALTEHKKLVIDPEAFSIVDPETHRLVDQKSYVPGEGVLYLNYDPGVNRKFNRHIELNIFKADFAWNDCLEHRPAATPRKKFNDFFRVSRPKDCPAE